MGKKERGCQDEFFGILPVQRTVSALGNAHVFRFDRERYHDGSDRDRGGSYVLLFGIRLSRNSSFAWLVLETDYGTPRDPSMGVWNLRASSGCLASSSRIGFLGGVWGVESKER